MLIYFVVIKIRTGGHCYDARLYYVTVIVIMTCGHSNKDHRSLLLQLPQFIDVVIVAMTCDHSNNDRLCEQFCFYFLLLM